MKINQNGKIRTRGGRKVSWWKKSAGAAHLFEETKNLKSIYNAEASEVEVSTIPKDRRKWEALRITASLDRQQARVVSQRYERDQEVFGKIYQRCSWEERLKCIQDLANNIDDKTTKILELFKAKPLVEPMPNSPATSKTGEDDNDDTTEAEEEDTAMDTEDILDITTSPEDICF
jgi:hypothetical protein